MADKLSEFTASETARRRKINNDAPESVIENLRNLCQNVLQPLRDYVGEPITSYKWHDGERHTDMDVARKWFDFLKYNTDYDQLILETSNHLDFWIHVSCRRDPKLNRHHVIYYMKKN